MGEKIITGTFYSEYFDESIKDIYLLEKNLATKLWDLRIDPNANNFFRLDDNNPIIYNSKSIGDWRSYYDQDDILGLQSYLNSNVAWKSDSLVFFCINRETIIKTNYNIFLNNIFNFLELHDDCPILLNESGECMYFAPFGNIFYSLVGNL